MIALWDWSVSGGGATPGPTGVGVLGTTVRRVSFAFWSRARVIAWRSAVFESADPSSATRMWL